MEKTKRIKKKFRYDCAPLGLVVLCDYELPTAELKIAKKVSGTYKIPKSKIVKLNNGEKAVPDINITLRKE
jgi:hypothetical protein